LLDPDQLAGSGGPNLTASTISRTAVVVTAKIAVKNGLDSCTGVSVFCQAKDHSSHSRLKDEWRNFVSAFPLPPGEEAVLSIVPVVSDLFLITHKYTLMVALSV